MSSGFLGTVIPLTRLGSGHRMAEVVRPLPMPLEIPERALNKYTFLSKNSFTLGDRSPPEMLASGEVRYYILLCLFLITVVTGLVRAVRGQIRSSGSTSIRFGGSLLGLTKFWTLVFIGIVLPRAQIASIDPCGGLGSTEEAKANWPTLEQGDPGRLAALLVGGLS
eukprot:8294632-Pyramimonas_sp.AAC.1